MQITQTPLAKYHIVSCSTKYPPYKCHLPVHHCTDPHLWGCIFKCAGFSEEEWLVRISSLHSNMTACGTWRRWRLIADLFPLLLLWTICLFELVHETMQFVRLFYYYPLDQQCSLMLLQWIFHFVMCMLSVIPGIACNTGVLPLSKGGALQNGIRA